MTTVEELAAGVWAGDVAELDFDADGIPRAPFLVVDADQQPESGALLSAATTALRRSRRITVAVGESLPVPAELAAAADVVLQAVPAKSGQDVVIVADPAAALAELRAAAERTPLAALSLIWLLRAGEHLDAAAGLAAESALYSALLGGREFRRWLAIRPEARPPDGPERVGVERIGDLLAVTLRRPGRRNAVDTGMRQALLEALAPALADPELAVCLQGEGPAFCAGGDLDEFGTASDLAQAHVIRTAASVGAVLHELADRTTAYVHGACIGAGCELPAFAGRVVAAPDAFFALPELAMGLVPGAGGTVSIPRRIGRRRTAWLALTGRRLDAQTALAWGLVDAIEEPSGLTVEGRFSADQGRRA